MDFIIDLLIKVFFTFISKFISAGFIVQSIFIVLFVILCVIFYKYIEKFYKIDLNKHSIFSNIESYDFSTSLNESKKSKAIKRFLKNYVLFYKNWLKKEVASDKEWSDLDLIQSYNKMIQEIEYCWIQDDAPMIFIDKWREYSKTSTEMIKKYIRQATESDFYETDIQKKLLILTICQVIFFSTLRDIDHIVYSLNGELDKIYE